MKTRIRRIIPNLILLALAFGVVSCKTTEKNYRAAYQVAQEKKEREETRLRELQEEMGVTQDALLSLEGESLENFGDKTTKTKRLHISSSETTAKYLISVGTFRLPTNARSMAEDLRDQGWEMAKSIGNKENWYVVIHESNERENIRKALEQWEEGHEKYTYPGQNGIEVLENTAWKN